MRLVANAADLVPTIPRSIEPGGPLSVVGSLKREGSPIQRFLRMLRRNFRSQCLSLNISYCLVLAHCTGPIVQAQRDTSL